MQNFLAHPGPCTLITLLMLAGALPAETAPGFFFHDGDQPIELIGDSITEQRLYTTLIESYVLSRFPAWHVTVRNVGWSGDTSYFQMRGGLENALSRDLLPLKPASATIDFGMNDARGLERNKALYQTSMTNLVQRLQHAGVRVAVLSPSPEERYEPHQPGGSSYNVMLADYSAIAKGVAQSCSAVYVDQFSPFIAVLTQGRAAGILGATGEPRLTYDGIHPNWGGHLIMASSILKGLSAPSLVSRLVVDAQNATITIHDQCQATMVTGPQTNQALLSIKRLDAALPWPLPVGDCALVESIPGFTPLDDLSQYQLGVLHLPPGDYQVLIDSEVVGSYSAATLAQGVNLSAHCGPIQVQLAKLLAAIIDKNNDYFQRWRNVQLYSAPAWLTGTGIEAQKTAELARLDAQVSAKEHALDQLRQPLSHLFQIRIAPPLPPRDLIVAPGTKGGAQVTWSASTSPATGYQIEAELPGHAPVVLAEVSAQVLTFTDPDPASAQRRYSVRTEQQAMQSDRSLGVSLADGEHGWGAEFFSTTTLSGSLLHRVDPTIDFDWSAIAPATTVPRENFSARWSGVLTAPSTGLYQLIATADDGVRVWVDQQLVIDQWRDQAATESTAALPLVAGQPHDVLITYYQGGGDASLKLEWSSAAVPRAVVPASAIRPSQVMP